MRKMLKVFSVCLVAVMLSASLSACGNNMMGTGYDLYIFNGKGESAQALKDAADAYSRETGKKFTRCGTKSRWHRKV